MKHKLKIYSTNWGGLKPRLLWYVYCNGCQWEPDTAHEWPDGARRYGRPSLALALAEGVRHQLTHLRGEARERIGSCPPCDDYDEIHRLNG